MELLERVALERVALERVALERVALEQVLERVQERVLARVVLERVVLVLEQVASAALPPRGSSVRRGRPQAEAQHRTSEPEEVVSAVEGLAVLAEAALAVAGLVAGLAVLAEALAVAGLAVLGQAVLAAVTVLTAVQLAPLESRDPACF